MTEAAFWTMFGPMLTEKINEINALKQEVAHWKAAYERISHSSIDLQVAQSLSVDLPIPELTKGPAVPTKRKDPKPESKAKRAKPNPRIQPSRGQVCGSCKSDKTPQWRQNIGDPKWGKRICNTCWCRLNRKKNKEKSNS